MSRLILIRHGQSIWNLQNRFTGWVDVSLSRQGVNEAQHAAELLIDEHFDVAFTSTLLRAQDSLYEILRHNRHCAQYVRVHELSSKRYEHSFPFFLLLSNADGIAYTSDNDFVTFFCSFQKNVFYPFDYLVS